MRIVPDSTITLYSGVFSTKGKQLVFNNVTAQDNYFTSHIAATQINCQMVKKRRGWLRLNVAGTIVKNCNYLSFTNPSFDNKKFYALITDYDYINNECVEIQYVIDNWQTWMFDFNMTSCLIDREHLSVEDKSKENTNPFDPSILELRTTETLPIGRDTEKPYELIGDVANSDGLMIGETMAHEMEIQNRLGVLITVADINFENLDSEATQAGQSPPSSRFNMWLGWMQTLMTVYDGCFYSLTQGTYEYLNQKYHASQTPPTPFHSIEKGSAWSSFDPGCSRITAPVNYFYIDGAAGVYDEYSTDNSGPMAALGSLLSILTDYSALDSLLGIYVVPLGLMLFSGTSIGRSRTVNMTTSYLGENVVNKKLDLYPYSYMRIIAPNGDIKELRYEDFLSVQDPEGDPVNVEICVGMDIYNSPSLIVAPRQYLKGGLTPNVPVNETNIMEGIVFNQFPSMPYTIDSYRAQMAAVANNIISNNTIDRSYEVQEQALGLVDKYVTSVAKILKGGKDVIFTGLTKGWDKGYEGIIGGTESMISHDRTANEWAQSEDAYEVLSGGRGDNAVYDNFSYSRPAYACNEYHMNNGDGSINYNYMNFMDIILLKVSLNPTIMEKYDQYFENYGYNSGRLGVPRIYNYIHGSASLSEKPSWHVVDNKYITYVKTTDCKVTGVMLPVAQAIQEMFDSGVQFVDPTRRPNQE